MTDHQRKNIEDPSASVLIDHDKEEFLICGLTVFNVPPTTGFTFLITLIIFIILIVYVAVNPKEFSSVLPYLGTIITAWLPNPHDAVKMLNNKPSDNNYGTMQNNDEITRILRENNQKLQAIFQQYNKPSTATNDSAPYYTGTQPTSEPTPILQLVQQQ